MLTVKELADSYRVSPELVLRAFEAIGYYRPGWEAEVPANAAARFERTYGAKIRAANAKLAEDPEENRLYGREPSVRREREQRNQHVMRVAHVRHSGKRDMRTMQRYKVLADDPGPDHAIDPEGTREGDPWRGQAAAAGEHKFYEYNGPHAACGVQVKVLMGERFEYEATNRPVCPKCAEIVAEGKGFRTPYWERQQNYWCDAYLRIATGSVVGVEQCRLREFHSGRHESHSGGTWDIGIDDYVPAPGRGAHSPVKRGSRNAS